MSVKNFSHQNICIFGCGKSGKLLYDSIKKLDANINCIFCDNDGSQHTDTPFEIVSPTEAVERVKSREFDAIVIPGTYSSNAQIAMITQLSHLSADADSIYITNKDVGLDNINFESDCLIKLVDICIDELHGNDFTASTVGNMKEFFLWIPRIQTAIDQLVAENDIDGKTRIMVLSIFLFRRPNNGNSWYFLSRVPIFERDNDFRLVILVDKDNADAVYCRSRFLEYDGYSFEFLPVDAPDIITPIYDFFKITPQVCDFFLNNFESDQFRIFSYEKSSFFADFFKSSSAANKSVVRKPRFRDFNRQYYIDTFGVNPGKTFWVIPDSNSIKSFPLSYWNAVAAILKNIGYTVVFNSKDPGCNGTLAFIPWEDVVGFAELCGHVIGTRTGFFDFSIIAKTNFYIFTPPQYLDLRVENDFDVDNSDGHIRTIPINSVRNFTNLPEFKYFAEVKKNFVEYVYNLSCEKDRYLIFITSKEAHCPPPGADTNKQLRALSLLGLMFNFSASYGWSYCAVIDGGDVVVEKSSSNKTIMFKYLFDGDKHKGEIISEGFNVNKEECQASVIIDGVQTSMNMRGLNIIVWDKNKGEIEESVVFDTFDISSTFDTDSLRFIELRWANLWGQK